MKHHVPLALYLAFSLLPQARAQSAPPLVLEHVTLIDPDQDHERKDVSVVVSDGRIQRITPSRSFKTPPGAQIVSLPGKFIIPGLWDMHTHWGDSERVFPLFIANGVLGTRNMAAPLEQVLSERSKTANGEMLGPRIFACGPVLEGPKPFVGNAVSIHGPDEARQVVDRLHAAGADFLKTYDGLPRDSYFAVAQEANRIGMPFEGHLPLAIKAKEAVDAGQKSFEHGAVLEGTSTNEDRVANDPAILRAIEAADQTHDYPSIPETIARMGNLLLDGYSEQKAAALYRDMAEHHAYICPTLVTERNITFIDDISLQNDPRSQYALPRQLRNWKTENGFLTKYRTPAYIAYRKREYAAILRNLKLAHICGVPILAGTDNGTAYTYPGFSLHDELALLVEAGLSPRESLQTATTNPARFWNLPDGLGTLRAGSEASFVVLAKDPLADIRNTSEIEAVVMKGKLFDRAALDDLLRQAKALAMK